ncbi:MAG: tetratricopeptide repeat protein [Proteobacteria bacterium]|nr:tetratricopeptide repeat protein [Pseudomonadota bacterium]
MNETLKTGSDEILGIFSVQKAMKIGTGTTSKRVQQTFYYFVYNEDEKRVAIQPMGDNYTPIGNKRVIDREELMAEYLPEPSIWQEKALPRMREVTKSVARGDKFRKRGETFTAEMEYGKAIKLDERNVRANFGIGLVFIARGEKEKAHEVFERVVSIEAAFEEEHKHLFNEFGINLRKSGMFDDAIDYYKRSMEISPSDENLHLNLARAYYEKGDLAQASVYVDSALKLNPAHEEGNTFRKHLTKKGV